jgi:hypothetical protein
MENSRRAVRGGSFSRVYGVLWQFAKVRIGGEIPISVQRILSSRNLARLGAVLMEADKQPDPKRRLAALIAARVRADLP